jgi:hypothetical protein
MTGLTQRSISSTAPGSSPSRSAGGVAAGVDEEEEEQVEVDVVEGPAVDLRREQDARDVFGRTLALRLGHLMGVGEHLEHRRHLGALGHRLGSGVDGLGQLVQAAPVIERDAEEFGDHERGQLAGDVGHEVALAPLDHGVDDRGGERLDAVTQPDRRPGREAPVDEAPVAGVPGRVHGQHHLVIAEDVTDGIRDHDRRHRREGLGVAADRLHVLVAGDRPESRAVGFGVAVDGVVLAQPPVLVVGLAGGERRRREEVDRGGGHEGRLPTGPWSGGDDRGAAGVGDGERDRVAGDIGVA